MKQNEESLGAIKRERSDDESSEEEEVAPQHEVMYAGVSNLFAACEATNATRPKRHRTEEEKRQERLSANRRSARESRNRKKLVFEELQRSVARLAEENASLRKENETIKGQMSALKRQFGLPDGDSGPAGAGGASTQGLAGQGGMGGVDISQGLNLMQQGENQGSGGGNIDQAQQLAMLEAAQQAQAQQQLQLAAAGLNPFSGNLDGGQGGGDGQGGDYQERLQLFQRRVEERSQLINQLKNSIGGGGGGGTGGLGGQGNNANLEALRRQLRQQGQMSDTMNMGAAGFS